MMINKTPDKRTPVYVIINIPAPRPTLRNNQLIICGSLKYYVNTIIVCISILSQLV